MVDFTIVENIQETYKWGRSLQGPISRHGTSFGQWNMDKYPVSHIWAEAIKHFALSVPSDLPLPSD